MLLDRDHYASSDLHKMVWGYQLGTYFVRCVFFEELLENHLFIHLNNYLNWSICSFIQSTYSWWILPSIMTKILMIMLFISFFLQNRLIQYIFLCSCHALMWWHCNAIKKTFLCLISLGLKYNQMNERHFARKQISEEKIPELKDFLKIAQTLCQST